MDKQFLEFWGKLFMAAAQGQQQMEEIGKWCTGNAEGCKDITAMWSKIYGLSPASDASFGSSGLWQEAMQGFQKSFTEFTALMDLVPRKDYEALAKENEALKNTVRDQEEQIAHLRTLLAEKIPGEGVQAFQGLMNEQVQNYQSFMQNMTSAFQNLSAATPDPAKPAAKKKAKS